MFRKQIAPVLVIVALVFSLAGCDGVATDGTDSGPDESAAETTVATPDASDLLAPDDVESVSDLTGLKVVPYDPAVGAGGDVNIADQDGALVAMLVLADQEVWDEWLTDGFTVAEPVTPPVGDESFIGPNPDVSPTIYTFGLRKGDTAIVINTYLDTNGETILSVEQLRQLAEIVAGRL